MDTENKILVGFLAATVIFYGSAMHTSVHEAEKKIKQDCGIEAQLTFEKGEEPNLLEQMEQERADSFNVTYSIVR